MGIESFDNVEDMFASMNAAEDAANANLTPAQATIGWGDYWIRVLNEYDLVIFGQVRTIDELRAQLEEMAVPQDEIDSEVQMTLDSYKRGYRFGMAYSVACVDGELGDTHIADMLGAISEDEFKAAQNAGWELREALVMSPTLRETIMSHLAAAIGRDPIDSGDSTPTL